MKNKGTGHQRFVFLSFTSCMSLNPWNIPCSVINVMSLIKLCNWLTGNKKELKERHYFNKFILIFYRKRAFCKTKCAEIHIQLSVWLVWHLQNIFMYGIVLFQDNSMPVFHFQNKIKLKFTLVMPILRGKAKCIIFHTGKMVYYVWISMSNCVLHWQLYVRNLSFGKRVSPFIGLKLALKSKNN